MLDAVEYAFGRHTRVGRLERLVDVHDFCIGAPAPHRRARSSPDIESVPATLHDSGFSIELAHHALPVLSSRIFAFTQDRFEEPGPTDPPPDEATMLRALAGYPRVVELAMAASHEGVLGPCDDDVEFAFGLDLTLDGLERARAGG